MRSSRTCLCYLYDSWMNAMKDLDLLLRCVIISPKLCWKLLKNTTIVS